MFSYFALISLPAGFALALPRSRNVLLLLAAFSIYVFLIGYRENVGMDWNNYLAIHGQMRTHALKDILFGPEAASHALFWFSYHSFSGIYTSNLVAAIILMAGVLVFSMRTNEPWLALVAATPYVCIVIGMSATRQAMAMGVIFIVFSLWHEIGVFRKAALIFMASLFHTSAILIAGFLVQDLRISPILRVAAGAIFVVVGIYLLSRTSLYAGQINFYTEAYLSTDKQILSPGALAHVAIVAVPALAYLFVRRHIYSIFDHSGFMDMSALICLALVPAAIVFSTAASRFSIYMQFFPMVFYPAAVAIVRQENMKMLVRAGIIAINLLFLFVWLRYANNSFAYLPYKNFWWQ